MKTCPSCNKLYPPMRGQCPTCGVALVGEELDDLRSGKATHAVKLGSLKKMAAPAPEKGPPETTAKVSEDMRAQIEAALASGDMSAMPGIGSSTERISPDMQNRLAAALVEDNLTIDSPVISDADVPMNLADALEPEPAQAPSSQAESSSSPALLLGVITILAAVLAILVWMLLAP